MTGYIFGCNFEGALPVKKKRVEHIASSFEGLHTGPDLC